MNHFRILFRKNHRGKYLIYSMVVFIPGENGVYLNGSICNYEKDDILFDSKKSNNDRYLKIADSISYNTMTRKNQVNVNSRDIKNCIELIEKHNDNIANNKNYTPKQKEMYSVSKSLYLI